APQHARIRAGTARVTRTDATVATHHHPRLLVKRADIRLLHRMAHDTRAAIAHDLHVELDGSDSFTLTYLFHVLEFVIGMSPATDDRDVRWSTNIREPTRDIHRIIMTSARNQNSNRRAPCFVGITIRRNIETASTRSIDERHCF